MSGGRLNYFYSDLKEHVGDFGDKELDELVKDLANLFYVREWFLSGDTSEGNWREERDSFKRKWFAEGARAERIVSYLEMVRHELFDSLGLSDEYCKNCAYWTGEKDKGSLYGKCDFSEHCLKHKSESCEKFKKKEEITE